jgi:SAM-dependent methyltransferase
MAYEMQKSVIRRLADSRFIREYFVGNGIDIGAGDDSLIKYREFFPLIKTLRSWDINDGDSQYLTNLDDCIFDFAVSSHCLEHMISPEIALNNWIRVIKPRGYLIITIPDEDLYEQGQWPSMYNSDHKFTFTINKDNSWSPTSINLLSLLDKFRKEISIKKIELLDNLYFKTLHGVDQTRYTFSESAIEIVLRKL